MRRVYLTVFLGIFVAVVLIGAYSFFKPARANQLADEAMKELHEGNLAKARQKAMAAKDLAGGSAKVARVLATVWGQITPSSVVPLWEKAVELSRGAKEDKQGLAMALLAAGELERAKTILAELMKENPNDPQTTFVQANWLIAATRAPEALPKVVSLVEQYPTNEDYWKVYSYLARLIGGEALEGYKVQLRKIKKEPSPLGLWALGELARIAANKDVEPAIKEMMAHPMATRDTMLVAYQIRRQKLNTPYDEIRREVSRKYNVADTAERRELASYYRTLGDYEGILEMISPKMAVAARDDLMLYLDALAGSGKWIALLEILNIDKLPIEDYWREIFRARTYAALKRTNESQIAWRKALVLAGNNPKMLGEVSQYLVALGAVKEVDEVMPRLIDNSGPLERVMYYQQWLQLVVANKDTVRAQNILEKMSVEYPKNLAVRNDYIYYSVLLKKPGEWVPKAYELATNSPGIVAHRMTLALALYRAGQAPRAYEVVNTTRVTNWAPMPVGWQLVRAAVLMAAGQAVPEVANAQQALPEERALVE